MNKHQHPSEDTISESELVAKTPKSHKSSNATQDNAKFSYPPVPSAKAPQIDLSIRIDNFFLGFVDIYVNIKSVSNIHELMKQLEWLKPKHPKDIRLRVRLRMIPETKKKHKTAEQVWDRFTEDRVVFDETLFFNSLHSADYYERVEVVLVAENLKSGVFGKSAVLGYCKIDLPALVLERFGVTWEKIFEENDEKLEEERFIRAKFEMSRPTEADMENIKRDISL